MGKWIFSVYKNMVDLHRGFTLIFGWNARIKGVIYLSVTVTLPMLISKLIPIIQSPSKLLYSAYSKVHILILKCDAVTVILLVIITILIKVPPSYLIYVTLDGTLIKLYILTLTFVTFYSFILPQNTFTRTRGNLQRPKNMPPPSKCRVSPSLPHFLFLPLLLSFSVFRGLMSACHPIHSQT
jgi:hypothetical protein